MTSFHSLLVASSLLELGAGAALLCIPGEAVLLLTGMSQIESAVSTVTRIGGAGLFALGVACWMGRNDAPSRAATGLVNAMLIYNLAAVGIFVWARLGDGLTGVLLWPGAAIHFAMLIWCSYALQQARKGHRIAESL